MVITVIRKSKYFKYIVAFGIIKKVILLVMFLVPLLSFSQVTFNDLMSIDSKDTFIKLMIDSEYSGISSDESDISFALIPTEYYSSSSFAYYYSDTNTFEFKFQREKTIKNSDGGNVFVENAWGKMYRQLKRRCNFLLITNVNIILTIYKYNQ